jgi:hypothetical protein
MCAQNIIWARASTLNSGCYLVRNYGNRDGHFLDGWHGILGFLIMKGLAWHDMFMLDSGWADRACFPSSYCYESMLRGNDNTD